MNFRISNDIRTFSLEVRGNIEKRPSFGFSVGATGRVIGVIDGGSYTEYRHGKKGKGCVNSPPRPEQASMRDSRNMASPVISGLYCKSAPELMLPSFAAESHYPSVSSIRPSVGPKAKRGRLHEHDALANRPPMDRLSIQSPSLPPPDVLGGQICSRWTTRRQRLPPSLHRPR